MIGSRGPNISSFITNESNGTSSRSVGAMNLLRHGKNVLCVTFNSLVDCTDAREIRIWSLTAASHPAVLHEQPCRKLYHHPRALLSEQNGWSSRCEINLSILVDFSRRISPKKILMHLSGKNISTHFTQELE